MRGFRANDLREDCDGPLIITGGVDVGPYPVPIGGDGRFLIEYDSTGTVGVEPATFHTKIAGLISGSAASGTASLASQFDYNGRHWSCASPLTTWTANLLP